jgi:hypothetical protein
LALHALVPAAALASVLLGSSAASAYDALAAPCEPDAQTCQIAPIEFDHKDSLPIEWSFDTGWVPQGSPLQVHIWAGIYASTFVSLSGALETTWPEAFVLRTPGDPGGGTVGFHYGVEIGAQGKVEIEVAGKKYSWVGDIPYFPQFDFQVEASDGFDAWGFPPGKSVSAKTEEQTLASVGIGDIIGGSIPGIDGGFELDVAMELEATYATHRIVLETTDGKPVKGGAIESDDGESSMDYLGGPSVELDVHPEGTVDYTGILHLIPAFYVELLGQTWSIPIADIPISFPITQTDWVFEKQRVHVPLPDLVVSEKEIDFGEVEVGQKNLEAYNLFNAGEADVHATIVSSNPQAFEVFDAWGKIEGNATMDSAIRFVPKSNGEFKATIYVGSNDPSDPVQVIHVKGVGYGGPGGFDAASVEQDAGCACSAAGVGASARGAAGGAEGRGFGGHAAGAMAAFAALSVVARRRRRERR